MIGCKTVPNELQLARIKADILEIIESSRVPSEEDWSAIVSKHCPGVGLDCLDLKVILQLATKKGMKR